MKRGSKSKLSRLGNAHPLMNLPRQVEPLEISILNGSILFDLELPQVWKVFTNIRNWSVRLVVDIPVALRLNP